MCGSHVCVDLFWLLKIIIWHHCLTLVSYIEAFKFSYDTVLPFRYTQERNPIDNETFEYASNLTIDYSKRIPLVSRTSHTFLERHGRYLTV